MATLTARKGMDVGTTDPEEQALLRAICATPGDDLCRLRYADWIQERGQVERAEFIRVACEAEKLRDTEPHHAQDILEHNFKWRGVAGMVGCDYGNVTWKRGFVSRIECTLAQFIGGECRDCRGTGRDNVPYGEDCDHCNGTGLTPGLVDTLFLVQPVVDVVISDLMPWNPEPRSGHSWWTEDSVGEVFSDRVPHDLYELLDSYDYADSNYKRYPTRESALTALSRACVSLGRKRAGLPPI